MQLLNTSTLIEVTVPGEAGPFPRINQQRVPPANRPFCFAHVSFLIVCCRRGLQGWGRQARLHPLCWALRGDSCLKETWRGHRSSCPFRHCQVGSRSFNAGCQRALQSFPGARHQAQSSPCTLSFHPYSCLGKPRPRDLKVLTPSPIADKGLSPIQCLTLTTHQTAGQKGFGVKDAINWDFLTRRPTGCGPWRPHIREERQKAGTHLNTDSLP